MNNVMNLNCERSLKKDSHANAGESFFMPGGVRGASQSLVQRSRAYSFLALHQKPRSSTIVNKSMCKIDTNSDTIYYVTSYPCKISYPHLYKPTGYSSQALWPKRLSSNPATYVANPISSTVDNNPGPPIANKRGWERFWTRGRVMNAMKRWLYCDVCGEMHGHRLYDVGAAILAECVKCGTSHRLGQAVA